MRILLLAVLLLACPGARAIPLPKSKPQTATIGTPVKVTVQLPAGLEVSTTGSGTISIVPQRLIGETGLPMRILMSTLLDLGNDAGDEKRRVRFLLGEDKEAKIHRMGSTIYIVLSDDPAKVPKGSYVKTHYRAVTDGVLISLSTAVVKGRESDPRVPVILKAIPDILASVKKAG